MYIEGGFRVDLWTKTVCRLDLLAAQGYLHGALMHLAWQFLTVGYPQ